MIGQWKLSQIFIEMIYNIHLYLVLYISYEVCLKLPKTNSHQTVIKSVLLNLIYHITKTFSTVQHHIMSLTQKL